MVVNMNARMSIQMTFDSLGGYRHSPWGSNTVFFHARPLEVACASSFRSNESKFETRPDFGDALGYIICQHIRMASNDANDNALVDIFQEPPDYYRPEKPHQFVEYNLKAGNLLSLRLLGHSPLWVCSTT